VNEEQKRKDAADREAIVATLKDQLKRSGHKSLIGNKGYRKYVKSASESAFDIDEAKVLAETPFDGMCVLSTSMDMESELAVKTYKQLWTVEDTFRTMKSIPSTRPMYHNLGAKIRGHVFCSFLALRLRCELETRMEKQNKTCEWAK